MNQYLTRGEILSKFYCIEENELLFQEGGRVVRVMSYSSQQEADAFFEEDALAHWMRALGRTWDDDDFREEPEPFEARNRRQSSEEL